MSSAKKLLVLGLVLYLLSFALPAVKLPNPPRDSPEGYVCAWFAFALPWGTLHDSSTGPVEWSALLLSGWVNPVFWGALLFAPLPKVFRIFQILTLCFIPFCWVSFHYLQLSPHVGHFVWILGIVAALFSADKVEVESQRKRFQAKQELAK